MKSRTVKSFLLHSPFARIVRISVLSITILAIMDKSVEVPVIAEAKALDFITISDTHSTQLETVPEIPILLMPVFLALMGASAVHVRRRYMTDSHSRA